MKSSLSLYSSIFLHIFAIGFLIFYEDSPQKPLPQVALAKFDEANMVKAVSIDQKELDVQVEKIKKKEAQQKAEEKALKQSIVKATADKKKEEQRLARLKQEKEELKKLINQAKEQKLATEKATLAAKNAMKKAHEEKKKLDKEVEKLASKREEEKEKQQKLQQAKLQEEAELERLRREKEKLAAEKREEESAASRAMVAKEVNRYVALIRTSIEQNWLRPTELQDDLTCLIKVKLMPTGDIAHAEVVEASGNRAFDESALRAVYKSAPLPVPQDAAAFKAFRELTLPFQPG